MGRVPCVASGTVPSAVTRGLWGMGAVLLICRVSKRRLPLGLVQHLLFCSVLGRASWCSSLCLAVNGAMTRKAKEQRSPLLE